MQHGGEKGLENDAKTSSVSRVDYVFLFQQGAIAVPLHMVYLPEKVQTMRVLNSVEARVGDIGRTNVFFPFVIVRPPCVNIKLVLPSQTKGGGVGVFPQRPWHQAVVVVVIVLLFLCRVSACACVGVIRIPG